MTQDMYDLEGWREVTCEESDTVRARNGGVYSSLTDKNGNYGPPVVFTEWQDVDREPMLRDYRYDNDPMTCRHYVREVAA
jgi:hypothetical protein